MDMRQVIGRRNRGFNAGWGEPSFLSTGIPQLKSNRPIVDAGRFMYSKHTIEGPDYSNDDLRLHAKLLRTCKEVLSAFEFTTYR